MTIYDCYLFVRTAQFFNSTTSQNPEKVHLHSEHAMYVCSHLDKMHHRIAVQKTRSITQWN